jgi:hypothetical protein
MCAVKDDQSVVVDREPDQDKSHDLSGPRIRCPVCGWTPGKGWTSGLVAAAMSGIRSTREECAPPAFVSGL